MIEQVNSLDEILEPYHGQQVYVKSEDGTEPSYWRFDAVEGWQKLNPELNMGSAYDMNKNIIKQLPNLSNKDLKEKTKLVTKFISETNNKYYMLLCRDLNYYTVLVNDPQNAAPNDYFGDVLLECLAYWYIRGIDLDESGMAIEIWVAGDDNEVNVMYFFPYDNGVIACR